MTYQETLDYMLLSLPMFQRIGAAAYKNNLDNTYRLMEGLGNPHKKLKCIHVAGTNGKGSTSHFLASILQEHGFKVGLHTSPHLKDFRERIRIQGEMISQQDVIDFVETHKSLLENVKPSFFEMAVGMAFHHFAKKNVDIAVIEVGMGGRLDSTNIITPLLSVITNIGFDHMQFLGDTLGKIAKEKAGIIKQEVPIVVGESHCETKSVFMKTAMEKDSPVTFADEHFSLENTTIEEDQLHTNVLREHKPYLQKVISPLAGEYQKKNLVTVCAAIETLKLPNFELEPEKIKKGIAEVVNNTHLMGRWQILSHSPLTICDTGHNEDGIQYVLKQIAHTPHRKLHFVLGMVNDKDVDKVLSMLPKDAEYYLCKADIPRGLEVEILSKKAMEHHLHFSCHHSVADALLTAKLTANEQDLVFIGGSTFTVAECV